MQKYKDTSLSVLFLVLMFGMWSLFFNDNISVIYQSYSGFIIASILLLAFDVLGIIFAVKSSNKKESPISKYLTLIGILAFIAMLGVALMTLRFVFSPI